VIAEVLTSSKIAPPRLPKRPN